MGDNADAFPLVALTETDAVEDARQSTFTTDFIESSLGPCS